MSEESETIEEAVKYWTGNLHAYCESGSPRDHLAINDIGLFLENKKSIESQISAQAKRISELEAAVMVRDSALEKVKEYHDHHSPDCVCDQLGMECDVYSHNDISVEIEKALSPSSPSEILGVLRECVAVIKFVTVYNLKTDYPEDWRCHKLRMEALLSRLQGWV